MATINTGTLTTINYNGTEVRTLKSGTTTVYVKVYVTFDEQGGSAVSDKYVYYGSSRTYGTLPTPTRSGYTFNGWFTAASGGTQITSSTVVSTTNISQTLYAQWTIAGPTNWLFVGTSGSYNYTANFISSNPFCPSTSIASQEADTWLTNNYPPGNYPTSTVFRVVYYRNNFVPCYNLYFVAV